ncbi:Pyridoxal phosphate homeostasis protein [Caulifigura coniformis]|uniref:Pyridoxal phosphate homeostasis protein n=1 Tax=Caulifigura coniformis TaxID=2527983 RepID=A0A517SAD6_9PLAN|nr:YggS family pyridoxal phosphate-dependent enzyme [Caulifigura coniformis]QDT53105.1 Pyridoxal phosphate homeostasis protein [Caulifigura coniformis]
MADLESQLAGNLDALDRRIRAAAERAGRSPNEVTLVVVTKYAPDAAVQLLPRLGRLDLGENRPQQLVRRADLVPEARWHLIGRLQTNKVRMVLPHTVLTHSVDSPKLLERLSQTSGDLGCTSAVLLEVNISGEASKQGFDPEQVRAAWQSYLTLPNLEIRGLMTMAPFTDQPEDARPVFRQLRELRDDLRDRAGSLVERHPVRDLSMGMSGDFEVAIEEGATLIRVGSAVFENIPQ